MRNRWLGFAGSICGSGFEAGGKPQELFDELDRCYSEQHRHYHNWNHISSCLDEWETARSLSVHPGALEMALWFHDAVYTPGAPDNEQLSADMVRSSAEILKLPSATVREAEQLILATRYLTDEQIPQYTSARLCAQDTALMRDIDLSILGKPTALFDKYEEAIALEYSSVPDRKRWERRSAVLEMFLSLPRLYDTDYFHARYEQQARSNLCRSIRRLRELLDD